MTDSAPIRFMTGRTEHARKVPFQHRFGYRVRMVEIDFDRFAEAQQMPWGFSLNRFNLLSLNLRKHGTRTDEDPTTWIRTQFESAGVTTLESTLSLITFPDVLGLGFSPISLWLLKSRDGNVSGILYEVHSTFGEQHFYVAPSGPTRSSHTSSKQMHVSPFMAVSGDYRFSLSEKSGGLSLLIENIEDGKNTHAASLNLSARPFTVLEVIRASIAAPWAGLSVIAAIHWQALKLWLKGAKYHSRPKTDRPTVTKAISPTPSDNYDVRITG